MSIRRGVFARWLVFTFMVSLSLALGGCGEAGGDDGDVAVVGDGVGGDSSGDGAGGDGDVGSEAVWPEAVPYDGWEALVHAGAVLGTTVEGRPVVVERLGSAGPVLLLMHTIHGNEAPAEQLGERTRTWLLTHPEETAGLQILYVTQVNPDGYVHDTRYNVNDVDLNRNFPASNFEPSPKYGPSPASEPETQTIVALVEGADPGAIVTVHSPLDAINYDGPAEALATQASEATGIPIDQDIGFYPGSFGSYAGIDLQIPTITLELPPEVASLADHASWLGVEEVAIEYVRELGGDGAPLDALVVDDDDDDGYEARRLGDSPALRPIVAERFGPRDAGAPVLVVAGLDGAEIGVLVAERLRALLLGRYLPGLAQRPMWLVTVANPDGLLADRPLNNEGCAPAAGFAQAADEAPNCVESEALAALLADEAMAAVIEVRGRAGAALLAADGDADALLAAVKGGWAGVIQETDGGAPGSLAGWAATAGVPALTMWAPEAPEGTQVARAERAALGVLAGVDGLE